MKSIAFIIALGVSIFMGCDDPTEVETNDISFIQKSTSDQNRHDQLMASSKKGDYTSDPFELKNVKCDGSKLLIEVAFSGGCAKHEFELVWPEVITMIYPPSFSVILIHDNGGDSCEAYLSKTLEFETDDNGVVNANDFAIMDLTVVNGSNANESMKMK